MTREEAIYLSRWLEAQPCMLTATPHRSDALDDFYVAVDFPEGEPDPDSFQAVAARAMGKAEVPTLGYAVWSHAEARRFLRQRGCSYNVLNVPRMALVSTRAGYREALRENLGDHIAVWWTLLSNVGALLLLIFGLLLALLLWEDGVSLLRALLAVL